MNTATNAVTQISIQGCDYSFKAPEGKQAMLHQAAERLNQVLAETKSASPLLDADRLLVLTALNLCAELIERQQAEPAVACDEVALSKRLDGMARLITQQLAK